MTPFTQSVLHAHTGVKNAAEFLLARLVINAIIWLKTDIFVILSIHYPYEQGCIQNPRMGKAMNRRLIHA